MNFCCFYFFRIRCSNRDACPFLARPSTQIPIIVIIIIIIIHYESVNVDIRARNSLFKIAQCWRRECPLQIPKNRCHNKKNIVLKQIGHEWLMKRCFHLSIYKTSDHFVDCYHPPILTYSFICLRKSTVHAFDA